ncbi:MAG TPA: SDR family NAD(P)-dependent oxidoreductase [Spirochaetota bacterium]|nr:SDR family NAD(P)-dependent oxidoreductase [Spirochaetota bacterium]HPG51723.1 SDR family NAD(P)-dependent oxidoreductase [Spirochaetota bacterium]HPN14167.1 SDR family NAD(P)-dependent oxidoreductase [Spirochaetota bacterium]
MAELRERYGNCVLVTGASSGIGLAFAHYLATRGFRIIMVSDEGKKLHEIMTELKRTTPADIHILPGDLADRKFLHRITAACRKYDPGIIINNAGYGVMGYYIQHDFEEYERMLAVDETAMIYLTHHFAREFYIHNRKGAIINITSANNYFLKGIPFSSVYSASKNMVKNVTEAICYELKPYGIDVINVSPGPTDTGFQDKAGTNRLFWCESPMNVVEQSFKYLGRKSSILTNPYTRAGLALYRLLPLPASVKTGLRAKFFRDILGKKEHSSLDGVKKETVS